MYALLLFLRACLSPIGNWLLMPIIPPRIVHKTRQGFIRTMSASMSSTPQQRLTYEEISQMNQRKDELKGLHQAYLDTHPEISRMLSDFMSSILLDKPDDVFLFASEHFGTFEGENGGHRPIVISGPSGVGKSTLVGMLIKSFPTLLDLVSVTRREIHEKVKLMGSTTISPRRTSFKKWWTKANFWSMRCMAIYTARQFKQ